MSDLGIYPEQCPLCGSYDVDYGGEWDKVQGFCGHCSYDAEFGSLTNPSLETEKPETENAGKPGDTAPEVS